ncbi:hypothetical protein BDZ97DRAFT_1756481 [Flammula alnicola]|nr:hypothetical protein BDZ97DRAFT_1756481 [Flammula alnicola]
MSLNHQGAKSPSCEVLCQFMHVITDGSALAGTGQLRQAATERTGWTNNTWNTRRGQRVRDRTTPMTENKVSKVRARGWARVLKFPSSSLVFLDLNVLEGIYEEIFQVAEVEWKYFGQANILEDRCKRSNVTRDNQIPSTFFVVTLNCIARWGEFVGAIVEQEIAVKFQAFCWMHRRRYVAKRGFKDVRQRSIKNMHSASSRHQEITCGPR